MKKVLIGMSGGVDSSVSAALLKEEGFEVIGATMKLWGDENTNNTAAEDAKKVCERLGIEHYVMDCKNDFKQYVIDDFISCYKNCKTPNPCIECNRHLKFGAFFKKGLELGCEYVSTGHYAKIEYSDKYKQHVLKRSDSEQKDQTYFLYNISKEVLSHIIFPLEKFEEKKDVRKIAESLGLNVAHKKDSQEVCFIPNDDYGEFLRKNINEKPKIGDIVLKDGTILGKHNGLVYYTVGQRKGLGISYKEPLYVLKLDAEKNQVIVGKEEELYRKELLADKLNFLLNIDLSKPIEVMAKVRYRAKSAKAMLYPEVDGKVTVVFEEPQRAITPGQSVVFYIDDIVLGGGKILA